MPDGRQFITRTHELPSEADAPPETEFERNGLLYQCVNIQKTEIPYEEIRTVTRDIALETDSAEPSRTLEKLEPVLEFSDGSDKIGLNQQSPYSKGGALI